MSYDYKILRPGIFTEEGVVRLTKIRDRARTLLKQAGAVSSGALLNTPQTTGDSWEMLACMDYLCERGTLREITGPNVAGQCRVFIAGREWEVQ